MSVKGREELVLQSRSREPLGFHLGYAAIAAEPPSVKGCLDVGRLVAVFAFLVLNFECHSYLPFG
jgi:hypothetical protein